MKTILVTGGTGFIGSHTSVELLQAGYQVVIVDSLINSKEAAVQRIAAITGKTPRFYKADLRDIPAVRRVFSENHIDAVIHFAGLKAVGESVQKPLEYYQNNLVGTIHLLTVMREYGCKTFVFSSSATVYGLYNPIPYVEGMPTAATSPYGSTKVMVEQMLMDLVRAEADWSVMLLRYFNPIGAHESGLIGEDPNGIPNNLVPYIAQVAIGKLEKLSIYGNDYDTPDGTCGRDYIHVVDLAKGHIAAVEYALSHCGVEAVNLGAGKSYSVLEVVDAYEKACGKPIKRVFAPRRAGDIALFYADAGKALSLLGWKAQRSLFDMCRDSWNFTLKNPNGL